jgi:hypothetical protein
MGRVSLRTVASFSCGNLDERLGLSELIEQHMTDSRGKKLHLPLALWAQPKKKSALKPRRSAPQKTSSSTRQISLLHVRLCRKLTLNAC